MQFGYLLIYMYVNYRLNYIIIAKITIKYKIVLTLKLKYISLIYYFFGYCTYLLFIICVDIFLF